MSGREKLEARAYELYAERYHRETPFLLPALDRLKEYALVIKMYAVRWMGCLLTASDELFREAQS
jgi:hypothetical protein